MIILGIDPGLASMGFGLISYDNVKVRMVDYGVLSTKPEQPLPRRLACLFEESTIFCKGISPTISP